MNEQLIDMQRQAIEQMKTAQSQMIDLNERMADSVMGMIPAMPTPLAEYMPKPAEMVSNYFDFLGEMRTANREFVESLMAAWTPAAEVTPTKKK